MLTREPKSLIGRTKASLSKSCEGSLALRAARKNGSNCAVGIASPFPILRQQLQHHPRAGGARYWSPPSRFPCCGGRSTAGAPSPRDPVLLCHGIAIHDRMLTGAKRRRIGGVKDIPPCVDVSLTVLGSEAAPSPLKRNRGSLAFVESAAQSGSSFEKRSRLPSV